MSKRMVGLSELLMGLVVVVLLAFSAPAALAQIDQAQIVYTYVSQFQVPRASWAQMTEDGEKVTAPLLKRLMADGTIIGWGNFEPIVHTPDGYTHATWWATTSLAGITRVLDEFRKAGPRPGQIASTRHEDLLIRSVVRHAASVSGGSGYLRVIGTAVQPGKGGEFVALIKKHIAPVAEDQMKKGTLTYFAIDEQYVVAETPAMRWVVYVFPNAEAMDKFAAAVGAMFAGMSPADNKAWTDGLASSTVPDSRRDILARVTQYASK